MSAATVDAWAPSDLYDERGDRMWVRADLYPTHGQARYAAYRGAATFDGCGFDRDVPLTQLRCRKVWMLPPDYDDGMWTATSAFQRGAIRYYEVTAISSSRPTEGTNA